MLSSDKVTIKKRIYNFSGGENNGKGGEVHERTESPILVNTISV